MKYPYELPPLLYDHNALEPYIDAKTMEIHHGKHHNGYVDKLNAALENYPEWHGKDLVAVLQSLDSIPADIRVAVKNNGGGHHNHSLFWQIMAPNSSGEPTGEIAEALNKYFGDFNKLKDEFSKTATGVFGSGWAWLVIDGGKLAVVSTPNQDSPISQNKKPILGLDVWEHAYYLKYQNRRAEYIEKWWNLVNWNAVEEIYKKSLK